MLCWDKMEFLDIILDKPSMHLFTSLEFSARIVLSVVLSLEMSSCLDELIGVPYTSSAWSASFLHLPMNSNVLLSKNDVTVLCILLR